MKLKQMYDFGFFLHKQKCVIFSKYVIVFIIMIWVYKLTTRCHTWYIWKCKATNFPAVDYGFFIYDLDKSKPGWKCLWIQARQTVVNKTEKTMDKTEIDQISKEFKAVIGKRDSMMVVCAPKALMSTIPNIDYQKTALLTEEYLQRSFGVQFDDVLRWRWMRRKLIYYLISLHCACLFLIRIHNWNCVKNEFNMIKYMTTSRFQQCTFHFILMFDFRYDKQSQRNIITITFHYNVTLLQKCNQCSGCANSSTQTTNINGIDQKWRININ